MRALVVLLVLCSTAWGQKCPVEPSQKPRCATQMIELVRAHHVPTVSPELLLCVVWTESAFCNIRRRNSRSTGFGQVTLAAQRSRFWKLAREHGRGRFDERAMLRDDGLSLAAASFVLAANMGATGGDVAKTLAAFAGPPNRDAVPSWLACAATMKPLALFERPRPLTWSEEDRKTFAAALEAANAHRPAGSRADPMTVRCD
jgi:hypothetical protein